MTRRTHSVYHSLNSAEPQVFGSSGFAWDEVCVLSLLTKHWSICSDGRVHTVPKVHVYMYAYVCMHYMSSHILRTHNPKGGTQKLTVHAQWVKMRASLKKGGTHDRRGSKKEHEEDGVQPLESQWSDSACGRWEKDGESSHGAPREHQALLSRFLLEEGQALSPCDLR